jgi:hypothetical protein
MSSLRKPYFGNFYPFHKASGQDEVSENRLFIVDSNIQFLGKITENHKKI